MITKRMRQTRDIWVGPLLICLISGALLGGGETVSRALEFARGDIASGQWWRLWTCNWVHLGGWHWFLNALSLLLWIELCPQRLRLRDWLARVLFIGGGVGLGLFLLSPGVETYVGLSGMIYGLFLLDLGRDAVRGDRFALLCRAFLMLRVGWECIHGTPRYERSLIGGQVVASSHVWGMVSAVIYGGIVGGVERLRCGRRSTTQQGGM